MARLDAFIERLASASGSELVFESSHGAVLSSPTGPRVLVRQALSTPLIVGVFAEILPSVMQTGRGIGMTTLNDSLLDLVKKGLVSPAEALTKAVARNELRQLLERAGIDVPA